MVEFEDSFSERMAQLEQEELERYQRDVLKNTCYSYDDETPNSDEFQSKLIVLMDLVRGLSSNLKRTASSIETGPEPPTMNLHSDVGHETTGELHSDDNLAVTEFPDSKEMMDFDDITGNDSSDSEEVPKVSESGLKVLSIYCAHMATKWSPVLDSQPIQGIDMSVGVYYDRFYDWKKKLDEVDYIGSEKSYIDDFLYGLKRELAVRIWEYKWKPTSLYSAFRIAEMEEEMMENDAPMVFDKNVEQVEENDCVILGIMAAQNDADMVFVEMSKPILEEDLLGIGVTEAPHNLLYERPVLSPFNLNENLYGSTWVCALLLNFSKVSIQDVSYEGDILEVSVGNSPSLSKLGSNPQVFDPGTFAIFKHKVYESQLNIDGHFHCSTLIELNEGNVVDGGVVFSVTNMQATLGPLGDTTVHGSSNGSTKAWFEGAELIIVVVLGQKATKKDDSSIVDEMPPTFQVDVKIEQLMAYKESDIRWTFIAGLQGMNGLVDIISVDGSYVDNASLGIFPYMLDIDNDNDKSNGVFVLFSNLSSYTTQALGYEGAVLWVSFSNFLFMSRSESNPQVVGPRTGANKSQLFENIGQRNWYGSMLFPSEVNFVYTTSDHTSPRLSNGHVIGVGNANIHFTAADMLSQRDLFGDEYFLITFSHFCMPNSDSRAVTSLIFDSAHRDSLSKSLFERANFMLLSKCLYCWTLSWDRLTNELEFVSSFESTISLLSPLRAKFAWDPGIRAIFVYILEDKDVFERVGKWIIPMDHISELIFTLPTLNFTTTSMVLYNNFFSKLMAWSNILSYNHIYAILKMQWTGHDLKHCVVSYSHFNMAHMELFVIICDHSITGWSSVCHYNKWVDLLHIGFLSAWCFILSWSYVMMQEIALLAVSRKVSVMALFPITCAFYSWWQYHSIKGKCIEPTICFVDLPECKNIGVRVADGRYRGAVENLKWYEEITLQGTENEDVQGGLTLRMWIQLVRALKQDDEKLNGVSGTILKRDVDILVILGLLVYTSAGEYIVFKKWLSGKPHASFCSNILKGFVWDPGKDLYGICKPCTAEFLVAIGKYFDMEVTTSTIFAFVRKTVGCGVASLEFGDVHVTILCEKHSMQCYDLLMTVFFESDSPTYSQWLDIHGNYNIWIYGEEFLFQNGSHNIARSAPKTTAASVLPFGIIFGNSKFMLCALLLNHYAQVGWRFGIYICNEVMLYRRRFMGSRCSYLDHLEDKAVFKGEGVVMNDNFIIIPDLCI